MALIKVRPTRTVEAFISEEPIGGLAVVCISTGGRRVKEGTRTTQELVVGAAPSAVTSGVRCPVITHGIVSGVICGAVVSAGDRVTCINITSGPGLASGAGKITPINTIIPVGAISQVSGLIDPVAGTISRVSGSMTLVSGALLSGVTSGYVGILGAALMTPGGLVSGVTGFLGEVPTFTGAAPVFSGAVPTFTGTAFNTARVVGKALDNGGIGSGIRLLVDIGA